MWCALCAYTDVSKWHMSYECVLLCQNEVFSQVENISMTIRAGNCCSKKSGLKFDKDLKNGGVLPKNTSPLSWPRKLQDQPAFKAAALEPVQSCLLVRAEVLHKRLNCKFPFHWRTIDRTALVLLLPPISCVYQSLIEVSHWGQEHNNMARGEQPTWAPIFWPAVQFWQ